VCAFVVCAAQPGKSLYTTIREFVENSLDVSSSHYRNQQPAQRCLLLPSPASLPLSRCQAAEAINELPEIDVTVSASSHHRLSLAVRLR
jgi:hypothetical protein